MKKIILIVCIASITVVQSFAEVSWELGLGANHGGVIGGTINKKVYDNFELYGGFGFLGAVGGVRYYTVNNLRINANYGYQGLLTKKGRGKDRYETIFGLNLGVDYMWDNGFFLGLVYFVTTNLDEKIDEAESEGYSMEDDSGKVKLSLGYRF